MGHIWKECVQVLEIKFFWEVTETVSSPWASMLALCPDCSTAAHHSLRRFYPSANWLSSKFLTSVIIGELVFLSWHQSLEKEMVFLIEFLSKKVLSDLRMRQNSKGLKGQEYQDLEIQEFSILPCGLALLKIATQNVSECLCLQKSTRRIFITPEELNVLRAWC